MPARFHSFRLRGAGVRSILRGGPVMGELMGRGRRVLSAAGVGHEIRSELGPNRARVSVGTATPEAMEAEVRDLNLTRALNAGRG